jgi:hypothetical protein
MRRRNLTIGLAIVAVLAFVFFVPVIHYGPPTSVVYYYCPTFGCLFPHFGSLTYWAFGVGGVWEYGCGWAGAYEGHLGVCLGGSAYVLVG